MSIKSFDKSLFKIKISFYLTTILTLLISILPLAQDIKPILPAITYIFIFQITMEYPNLISPLYLFLLGIVNDAVYDLFIGTSSFCYLIVKYLILYHRKRYFSFNFIFTWLGFAVTIILVNTFMVFSVYLLGNKQINFPELMYCTIATILFFPLTYHLFKEKIDHDNL